MREFPLVDGRTVEVVPDRGLRDRGGWREPGAAGVPGGEGVERVDSPTAPEDAFADIFDRPDFVGSERGGTLQYEPEFLFTGLSPFLGSGPPFVFG